MQNTFNVLNQEVAKVSFGVIVYRGKVVSLGKVPASELRYTQDGTPFWRGNVSYEKVVQSGGKSRTIRRIKQFSAFGDLALQLGSLHEGNDVMLIAEDTNSKGNDGKWYDNAIVLAFDILA